MKNRTIIRSLFAAAAASILLAGCSNEELLPHDGTRTPVSFTAAVQTALPAAKPHTRTTIFKGQTIWIWGDRVGVYMYEAGSDKIIAGAENSAYTVNNSTSALSPDGTPIYYPMDQAVDFVSYYPYLTNPVVEPSITDQSLISKQCAIDYLYSNNAKNIQKNRNSVALEFLHLMSKVKFDIYLGDGLAGGKITKAVLQNQHLGITVDLRKGQIYQADNNTPLGAVTMLKSAVTAGANATYTALISQFDSPNSTIVITVNGIEYTGPLSFGDLEPNTMYVYPVTVKNTIVTVGTATIVPWEDLKPVEGDVL